MVYTEKPCVKMPVFILMKIVFPDLQGEVISLI